MSHFYRGMVFLPCGNVYLCRLNKETDTGMETKSQNLKDKLYMWYKVRELQSKGLNKTQIGKYLGVDRSTVRRYLRTSREEFSESRTPTGSMNSSWESTRSMYGVHWKNTRTYRLPVCMTGSGSVTPIFRGYVTRPYSIL